MPIRILLADDHPIVRQGLRVLLEDAGFVIVADACDGREAVRLAQTVVPDVAVLDLMMPLLNGIDASREILKNGTATSIVLMTMCTEDHLVAAAFRAGVSAYFIKTQPLADLVCAIQEAARGQIWLSPGISRAVVDGYLTGDRPPKDLLKPRERQVLQLVAEGRSSKEIAVLLGLSVKTAESYRFNVMVKLNIHETAGLVRYAIRQGLITP